MAAGQVSSQNGSQPIAAQELGTNDSGFRRRIASVNATEDYFQSLRNVMDHVQALEKQGILNGDDVTQVAKMVQNTFRQDHPLLEVDDSVPTLEDLCLNINDQVLAEKMSFINEVRQGTEGRQRKWEEQVE